jgi:hypothetical protein
MIFSVSPDRIKHFIPLIFSPACACARASVRLRCRAHECDCVRLRVLVRATGVVRVCARAADGRPAGAAAPLRPLTCVYFFVARWNEPCFLHTCRRRRRRRTCLPH